MKKRTIFYIILTSVVFALLLNIFFGSWLAAKVSNWGFVKKFNLLKPQAPIVIHTREEVRVSDSEDVVLAANKVKAKISGLFAFDGKEVRLLGAAVNLGQEGVFATTVQALGTTDWSHLYVKPGDSELVKVESVVLDRASNIVLLKARTAIQPASLANSQELQPGQRVILVGILPADKSFYFLASFVSTREEVYGTTSADRASRSFSLQPVSGMLPSQPIVNLAGDIVGLWDGTTVIPSDTIQNTSLNYFANQGLLRRPYFGFFYRTIVSAEAGLRKMPRGVEVVSPDGTAGAILVGSPAAIAGLRQGDIVTQVNGTTLADSATLEIILEKIKPGERAQLTVQRAADSINLVLTAGELK